MACLLPQRNSRPCPTSRRKCATSARLPVRLRCKCIALTEQPCSEVNGTTFAAGRVMTQPSNRTFRLADQLLEEGPVMDHRLAQLFGAGLTPGLPKRDRVGRAIV